jgi:lambda repressor-like predicted transcriptional regulator
MNELIVWERGNAFPKRIPVLTDTERAFATEARELEALRRKMVAALREAYEALAAGPLSEQSAQARITIRNVLTESARKYETSGFAEVKVKEQGNGN